jgi:hypothetical protein
VEGRNMKTTDHAAKMKGNGHNMLIGKSYDNYWKEIYIYMQL